MNLTEAIQQAHSEPAAYVIGPADGSYLYKGSARHLKERFQDHQAGRVSRTKNHRPLEVFLVRYFPDYSAARRFENHLKTGQGREWLRSVLGQTGQTVPPKADPP